MEQEIVQLLLRDGIIHSADVQIVPLTGGVSSEIFCVQEGGRKFAVKRALKKLKVEDDWYVDQSRNGSEVEYLRTVRELIPDAVPEVLYASQADGYFVMEYLEEGFANWKTLLLDGVCDPDHARQAAIVLAGIHRGTWNSASVQSCFETTPNFIQLRLDPYLLTAGRRHPDLEPCFAAEVERILAARLCLVHGDYSPKNILLNQQRLVVLDCEVAWFGDPTFDVAFLLNHFFLKNLHTGRPEFYALIETFAQTYQNEIGSERFAWVSPHLGRLLLMLMLARVDGKSPVEYLRPHEEKREWLRRFTRERIPEAEMELAALLAQWKGALRPS